MRATATTSSGLPAPLPATVGPAGQTGTGAAAAGVAVTIRATATVVADGVPAPVFAVAERVADGGRVGAWLPGGAQAGDTCHALPEHVVGLHASVDDAQALVLLRCAVPAWHMLRGLARVSPGDVVLVAGAAAEGEVATPADVTASVLVQLARQWGAGRSVALEDPSAASLVAAAGGHGADIVLGCRGGSWFEEALPALAPFGRLVVWRDAGAACSGAVPVAPLVTASRAVMGFDVRHAMERPAGLYAAMTELVSLLRAGQLALPAVLPPDTFRI